MGYSPAIKMDKVLIPAMIWIRLENMLRKKTVTKDHIIYVPIYIGKSIEKAESRAGGWGDLGMTTNMLRGCGGFGVMKMF